MTRQTIPQTRLRQPIENYPVHAVVMGDKADRSMMNVTAIIGIEMPY